MADDRQIIEKCIARDESALEEIRTQYGAFLQTLAERILGSREDAEECVSDALYKAWQCIPPEEPAHLGAYLGKIVRNLAIDRLKARDAAKRGGGIRPLVWDDLPEVSSPQDGPEESVLAEGLAKAVNRFVQALPPEQRDVFVRRFWYLDPVSTIAARHGSSEGRISMMLRRLKDKLSRQLKKEGWIE